jgi:hypothetical protein
MVQDLHVSVSHELYREVIEVGSIALDFCVLQFSIESLQKLTPTAMVTAWPPDVLMTSGASFHSAVMCRKRLPIGVGE